MQLHRRVINLYEVQFSTSQNQEYVEKCKDVAEDRDKKYRLEDQECVVCYNNPKIGGAAVSSRQCGMCDKYVTSGNTAADVLCMDCAKKHKLCKHCGADINLKDRRKL